MTKVDHRVVTMDIPSQDIISKDNVTLKVNGVVYFRVNTQINQLLLLKTFYMPQAKLLKQH